MERVISLTIGHALRLRPHGADRATHTAYVPNYVIPSQISFAFDKASNVKLRPTSIPLMTESTKTTLEIEARATDGPL